MIEQKPELNIYSLNLKPYLIGFLDLMSAFRLSA